MVTTQKFGPFRLDTEAQMLFRGAEPVALGRRAVALLRVLVERAGTPVPKDCGEHVDADGNPDLSFHGILGSAVEMLDA
jgi:hypothetical protein